MPKGPKGEKRPADVIGNAVKVMRIAVGDESDVAPAQTPAKDFASLGGRARSASLSPERKKEIAQKAAASRWKRD